MMQRIPKLHSTARLRDAWPKLPIIRTPIVDGIGGGFYCSVSALNPPIWGIGRYWRGVGGQQKTNQPARRPHLRKPNLLPFGSLRSRTRFCLDSPRWLLAGLLQTLLQGGHQIHYRSQLARLFDLGDFFTFELRLDQLLHILFEGVVVLSRLEL